ncbi:N-acetyltransferase [Apibacter muscae]|uniref:N-acetyltransferase n=1 Tax=Apibacter muscae TaxID=2509004 RepID=A0A563DGF6_9FLAO|nr:GNAT family N-acetyltransferase [Apibacter muscae]TWP29149.1 N-acetyltransferase [Apibacter muscae]
MKSKENRLKIANQILTQAFKENKSANYVVKKSDEKHLSRLMNYALWQGENFGNVFLNDEQNTAAVVIEPQRKKTTLKSLYQDVKFVFNVCGLSKAHKALKKENITHKTFPKNIDYIQLWFLGVEKDQQGQGLGSQMIHKIKDFYKGKTQAILLETSTLKNIAFYQKNGFEVYHVNQNDFGFDFYFLIFRY